MCIVAVMMKLVTRLLLSTCIYNPCIVHTYSYFFNTYIHILQEIPRPYSGKSITGICICPMICMCALYVYDSGQNDVHIIILYRRL